MPWHTRICALALALGAMVAWNDGPALAADGVCANPVEPEEQAVCGDPFLRAIETEINALLRRIAAKHGGEVPEGIQMPYAHAMIGRSECGREIACLETVMRDQLRTLNEAAQAPVETEAVCANPVEPEEHAVCEDPYLRGIETEISVLLARMADMNGGEVPEAVQMPYAHGMIARSECGDSFRCLESVMRDQLDTLNRDVLEWQDTPLVAGEGVAFVVRDGVASAGADLIPSKDISNFGWSQRLCQLRCAITDACIAAHYNALKEGHGEYGYCSMKSAITIPLASWEGVFLIRQSAMDF